MKAVVLDGPGQLSIKTVPDPEIKDGWPLIKMKAAGICGSDVNAFKGKGQVLNYPIILGHEVAGEVIETRGPSKFHPGDRVMVEPYLACGTCYACSRGQTNCCEHLRCLGVQTDGAMSEYLVHPESLLHPIPDAISWTAATVSEPLTVAMHGIQRAGLTAGEYVAIIGAGTIGMLSAMYVLYRGGIPILIDPLEKRLNTGKNLGVVYTINPSQVPAQEAVMDITQKKGAEIVLEISGSLDGVENTVHLASYCGRIVLTGWPSGNPQLNTPLITRKELIVYGSRNSARIFPEALSLIAGNNINVQALISKTVPFETLAESIKDIAANPTDVLKVVGIF
jgi:2-desacetyl-2-hydroxyethyl bacteriochlorophyllide A dehydrogenase